MDPMFKMVVDIDTLPTVLTMEREGCWGKPLLGCCALTAGCKDGMYLHAGSVGLAHPGDVKLASAQCVSFATQPLLAGGFTPTLNVMERAGPGWTPLAKVEGPCCFGGCLELCRSSKFTVSSLRAEQLEGKLEVGDVATIIKQKPRSLEGALREMVTDADIQLLRSPTLTLTLTSTLTLTLTLTPTPTPTLTLMLTSPRSPTPTFTPSRSTQPYHSRRSRRRRCSALSSSPTTCTLSACSGIRFAPTPRTDGSRLRAAQHGVFGSGAWQAQLSDVRRQWVQPLYPPLRRLPLPLLLEGWGRQGGTGWRRRWRRRFFHGRSMRAVHA